MNVYMKVTKKETFTEKYRLFSLLLTERGQRNVCMELITILTLDNIVSN